MLWSYENTFCVKKTKITTSFNNFFSSMSVFATHLLEYYDACVWCYWRRSQHSEPGCTAPGLQAENDFDREDYKQKMILTERITSRKWFWQRGWLCKFCTKSILVASQNDRWTTDVTWTILTMSLLPFWALNLSVVLLSMEDQTALGFHQKYFVLSSEDEGRYYGFGTTWGWVIIDRIWFFGVNYP